MRTATTRSGNGGAKVSQPAKRGSLREGLPPVIAAFEYEEWPRGRIVYDTARVRFILYADAQILRRPTLLTAIYARFGLPTDGTDAKRDDHYRSTRRLRR